MKELESLIRLKKWSLDERRRDLAELQRLRAELCGRADALDAELERERNFVAQSEIPSPGFSEYLNKTIKKRAQLSRSITQIDGQIAEAENLIAIEFEALKQAETALEKALARQAAKEKKLEQAELDEIAGVAHHRRSAARVSV